MQRICLPFSLCGKHYFIFPMSVYYRMFALTPQMEPVERNDQNQIDASIDIEIMVCILFL